MSYDVFYERLETHIIKELTERENLFKITRDATSDIVDAFEKLQKPEELTKEGKIRDR